MKQAWARQGVGGSELRASGRGLACRSGVERQGGATRGARFSHLWNQPQGKGLMPGPMRELTDGKGN